MTADGGARHLALSYAGPGKFARVKGCSPNFPHGLERAP
jgi:hypothetical protein